MQINYFQPGNLYPWIDAAEGSAEKTYPLCLQIFQTRKSAEKLDLSSRDRQFSLTAKSYAPSTLDRLEKLCPGFQADPAKALAELKAVNIFPLLINLDTLGLRYRDRLRLVRELMEKNPCSFIISGTEINASFSKFGLIEEVKNCKDINGRIDLCREFAANGDWAAEALAKNLDALGLKETNTQQTLLLCRDIIAHGVNASTALTKGIAHLGLEKIPVPQQLSLFDEIMSQGKDAATAVACNLGCLKLDEFEMSEKLSLYRKIMKHGDCATSCLMDHIDKLGLNRMEVNERLALCREVIAQGEWASFSLMKNFDALGLEQAKLTDRVALCQEILMKSESGAEAMVKNFDKLGLEGMKLPEKLALCQKIVAKGQGPAIAFISNFNKFGLEKLDASEKFSLLWESIRQDPNAALTIAKNIEKLGLKEMEVKKRLSLLNLIASKGSYLSVLAEKLDRLGLEEATMADKVALFRKFGSACLHPLIKCVDKLNLTTSEKRQIILELLAPPHDLNYSFIYRVKEYDFLKDLVPTVSFIINSEGFVPLEKFLKGNEKLAPLLPIFNKIVFGILAKKDDPVVRAQQVQLAKWVAYTAGIFFDLKKEQIREIEMTGILDDIFAYHNPQCRYALMRQLSQVSTEELRNIPQEAHKKTWSRLSWLLLSKMKQPGFTDQNVARLLNQINEKSGFKNTTRFNHLAQFLISIIEGGPYELEDMVRISHALENILSQRVPKKPKKGQAPKSKLIDMISNDLLTLTNIVQIFGIEEFINCLKAEIDYDAFFLDRFRDLFGIEKIEDFGTRYQETFASFRNNTALYSYLRSVNKLTKNESENVFRTLSAYVNAVLNGNFPDARYDTENSQHLKFLFERREGLKEAWLDHGQIAKVTKTGELEPISLNYKEFFFQKMITDKHLAPKDFPLLCEYLQTNINTSKFEDKAQDPNAAFQLFAIDLCENRMTAEEFIEKVEELKPRLGEFQNDLKSLKPQQSAGEYIIYESTDPCDLLLIGTEINGSCQRVDGDPQLNKGLAAYLMNGEIITIVVKREDQPELVARAVLRLLWDSDSETEVLLLERIYSNVQDKSIDQAIQRQALLKAGKMKIPLVSKEVGKGELYTGSMEFFGGFAPFTYSDAAEGIMEGAFNIDGCHVLFDPKQASAQTLKQG